MRVPPCPRSLNIETAYALYGMKADKAISITCRTYAVVFYGHPGYTYFIPPTPVLTLTRKDMALSAISMNSALADKEFVLSLHHKLHVSTCINKPNDVHKYNQSIIQSINHFYINNNETSLRDETISRYLFKEGVL